MDLIATDKFWGSNVLFVGFQGFSQTIFWRFLFMVAAVLDNDNDFLRWVKNRYQFTFLTSPNRLVKIRHVNIQPAIDVNRYQIRTLVLQQTALSAEKTAEPGWKHTTELSAGR